MTSDIERADVLRRLIAGIAIESADGRAGIRAILREIEAAGPRSIEVMAADSQDSSESV